MSDLKYAMRTLFRAPAFTITAAVTLALGIGATTAIFSVVNAVLLAPLPYRDSDRLVVTRLSFPDYQDLRRSSTAFEESAVWARNLYTLQIRSLVRSVDPNITTANVRQMTDVVSGTVAEPRFTMLLVSGFALLALLLAAVGIYGVIAYSVAQRTPEIGLRMALGAERFTVLSMVIREGLVVSAIGVAIGLAAAALGTRLMSDLLVGITPHDPTTFAASAATLLLVATAASYLPARRATRVDPMVALRAE